ncbi:sugar ABC transporter permease [Arthrobacter sp. PGP41]|uniref:ABC transporter permease n=1 Tax=unclassified Arthrobacter TaxID=235627 RepID=UPI000CDCDDFE|nr:MULTISPECIES: ABC transporter permease [unclassified Arthrobacter]AUZ33810.1 sugar ABC transporter permease [Arthrobacter sp. PGP41]MDT0195775.1 ABC transporter permease [Arthrobacter sp. AB6]
MRTTTDHAINQRSSGRGGRTPEDAGTGTSPGRDTGRGLAGIAANVLRRVPGPLIGLIAVMIALSIMSPYFLTWRNLSNVVTQNADIGIMAVGAALVILIGGIDLSVGSTLALSLMTSAWLYRSAGVPFELCVVLGLTVGAAVGLINGVLSTYGRIQPFVATLATMSAAAGLALYLTNGNPINGFPEWYLAITSNDILGIPLEGIIMVATFLIAAYWLRFRPSGRALYAIGGNAEVARLSGLNVTRIKIGVYVVAGFLAALAGVIVGSRLDSAQPTAGTADLLNVIAVVVIGGASLSGGSGGMLNTFIGLLIIGVLNNGMSLLNVSPNLQPVVIGVAIIVAVLTDRASRSRQGA